MDGVAVSSTLAFICWISLVWRISSQKLPAWCLSVKRVLAGAVVTPCTCLHTLNSVFLGKLMPYPVPLL